MPHLQCPIQRRVPNHRIVSRYTSGPFRHHDHNSPQASMIRLETYSIRLLGSGISFRPGRVMGIGLPNQSLNDITETTGPTATLTYRFVVHQPQNQVVINPFYYVSRLWTWGSLGTQSFLKRFNSQRSIRRPVQAHGRRNATPATLMIVVRLRSRINNNGSPASLRDLSRGKFCGLLSYDASLPKS